MSPTCSSAFVLYWYGMFDTQTAIYSRANVPFITNISMKKNIKRGLAPDPWIICHTTFESTCAQNKKIHVCKLCSCYILVITRSKSTPAIAWWFQLFTLGYHLLITLCELMNCCAEKKICFHTVLEDKMGNDKPRNNAEISFSKVNLFIFACVKFFRKLMSKHEAIISILTEITG